MRRALKHHVPHLWAYGILAIFTLILGFIFYATFNDPNNFAYEKQFSFNPYGANLKAKEYQINSNDGFLASNQAGYQYTNQKYGFTLSIPQSWQGIQAIETTKVVNAYSDGNTSGEMITGGEDIGFYLPKINSLTSAYQSFIVSDDATRSSISPYNGNLRLFSLMIIDKTGGIKNEQPVLSNDKYSIYFHSSLDQPTLPKDSQLLSDLARVKQSLAISPINITSPLPVNLNDLSWDLFRNWRLGISFYYPKSLTPLNNSYTSVKNGALITIKSSKGFEADSVTAHYHSNNANLLENNIFTYINGNCTFGQKDSLHVAQCEPITNDHGQVVYLAKAGTEDNNKVMGFIPLLANQNNFTVLTLSLTPSSSSEPVKIMQQILANFTYDQYLETPYTYSSH